MTIMKKTKISLLSLSALMITAATPAAAVPIVPTETVLRGYFGVNLHMDNCCGDYSDVNKVISRLQYIGARRVRDWPNNDGLVNKWLALRAATGVTFHASMSQSSPDGQRRALTRTQNWIKAYPGLIDVIEGTNEPDTAPAAALGASLADSARFQTTVYNAGVGLGVKVAQLSVGAGWTAPLWEGNYKNFGKPPAHYGNAHTYPNPGVIPSAALKRIGDLAAYSVDGKTVDHTEFGIMQSTKQTDDVNSAFMHIAPFSAYLLGHVGLSVYALTDDSTNVVGFYKMDGTKRAFADYWHHTTRLLSDPNGKNLHSGNVWITFTNQKSAGVAPAGIKNIVMHKSNKSIWIATYDEEKPGAAAGSQTINFNKLHPYVRVWDGRTGQLVNSFRNLRSLNINLPINHIFLVELSGSPS